jgi:hypothetical protein
MLQHDLAEPTLPLTAHHTTHHVLPAAYCLLLNVGVFCSKAAHRVSTLLQEHFDLSDVTEGSPRLFASLLPPEEKKAAALRCGQDTVTLTVTVTVMITAKVFGTLNWGCPGTAAPVSVALAAPDSPTACHCCSRIQHGCVAMYSIRSEVHDCVPPPLSQCACKYWHQGGLNHTQAPVPVQHNHLPQTLLDHHNVVCVVLVCPWAIIPAPLCTSTTTV